MARIKCEDVLEGMAIVIANELERLKINKEESTRIAVSVTNQMRSYLGGQSVYFPKDVITNKSYRDQEIFKAFDGTNYQELAIKHELSEMRIRQIVSRAVRINRAKRLNGDHD